MQVHKPNGFARNTVRMARTGLFVARRNGKAFGYRSGGKLRPRHPGCRRTLNVMAADVTAIRLRERCRPRPRWRPLYAAGCRRGRMRYAARDRTQTSLRTTSQHRQTCRTNLPNKLAKPQRRDNSRTHSNPTSQQASKPATWQIRRIKPVEFRPPWRQGYLSLAFLLGFLASALLSVLTFFLACVLSFALDFAFAVVSGVVPSLGYFLSRCSLARSRAFLRFAGFGWAIARSPVLFVPATSSAATLLASRVLNSITLSSVAELGVASESSASGWVGLGCAGGASICASISSCAGPWSEASPSPP